MEFEPYELNRPHLRWWIRLRPGYSFSYGRLAWLNRGKNRSLAIFGPFSGPVLWPILAKSPKKTVLARFFRKNLAIFNILGQKANTGDRGAEKKLVIAAPRSVGSARGSGGLYARMFFLMGFWEPLIHLKIQEENTYKMLGDSLPGEFDRKCR